MPSSAAAPATTGRSPDNIAPIVAYLASEQSGWITGRVIHSMGYEVSLYSNPEPVVRIIGTEPQWDTDDLADQVERSFGPQPRPEEGWPLPSSGNTAAKRKGRTRSPPRRPSRSGTVRAGSYVSSGASTAASLLLPAPVLPVLRLATSSGSRRAARPPCTRT